MNKGRELKASGPPALQVTRDSSNRLLGRALGDYEGREGCFCRRKSLPRVPSDEPGGDTAFGSTNKSADTPIGPPLFGNNLLF